MPTGSSGHNNYALGGPGACTGQVLILVGYSPTDVQGARALYANVTLAAVDRCPDCVDFERTLPIYVLSGATGSIFPRLWPSLRHFD